MPPHEKRQITEEYLLAHAVARLRAGVMAVVFGFVGGIGLFFATAWLLVRGGQHPGKHLGLLANFFPGYAVTWPGSVVGFLYGAALGAIAGWFVAWIYNYIAGRATRV